MTDETNQQPVEQAAQQSETQVTTEQVAGQTTEQTTEQPETTEQTATRTFTQAEVDETVKDRLAREKAAREKLEFENFQLKQFYDQQQQQYNQTNPQQQQDGQEVQQQAQQTQQQTGFNPAVVMQMQTKAYQSETTTRQKNPDYDAVVANPVVQYGLNSDPVFLSAVMEMDDPAGFLYAASKNHTSKLQAIITNPNKAARFKGLVELELELKQKANVPKVSQAPAVMNVEKGDGNPTQSVSVDAILANRRSAKVSARR